MKAIGTDIIDIKRIKKLSKKNKKIIYRILHEEEIKILKTKNKKNYYQFLAGRFAIKEAIFKCSNKYFSFNKLNIAYNQNNQPILIHNNNNIENLLLSISHEKNFAIATAILL